MASAGRIGCVRRRQRRADHAALFLASDDAASITGAELIVDGGETII
jgi:NAD(P)-dependent dehydrogenase (short-subunit alcohol dehydrogenase family)